MKDSFIQWLRCPLCLCGLKPEAMSSAESVKDYNVLVCRCSQYPIVAGIPILRKGVIGTARLTADEVITLIQAGKYRESLVRLTMPPAPPPLAFTPKWVKRLPSAKGINRFKALTHAWVLRRMCRRLGELITSPGREVTAVDLLDYYFRRADSRNTIYEYFAFRFGQPRHLVALSLMSILQPPQQPVLDLCCGFGHMTHSLVQQYGAQSVIGVDRNYFGLCVAKNFIAPDAEYVCADVTQPLPFSDDVFAVVSCVDGLHCVANKSAVMQEIKRIANDDGLLLFVATWNALFPYIYAFDALSPEGYRALVADMPHRLVADRTVLSRYFQRQGPPLAESANLESLASAPRLSIAASYSEDVLRDHGAFADWPHAKGALQINPLFVQERGDSPDARRLRRVFPSAFYERDNPEYAQYLPKEVLIDKKTLRDLHEGKRTPAIEQLIDQCVVIGLPARYSKVPGELVA
jgi:ubiquinone/menaquinone biosynthesis C-methylase UbiE